MLAELALTVATPRRLTDLEIEELVAEVVAGGAGTLDDAITRALFGDEAPPESWGDWPTEAIRVWDKACSVFMQHRIAEAGGTITTPGKRWTLNTLDLRSSWNAIVACAPNPRRWWLLPAVTWAAIGRQLELPPRIAAYRMAGIGWKLSGVGLHVPDRKVVAAPCIVCGAVTVPAEIRYRRGPCCAW